MNNYLDIDCIDDGGFLDYGYDLLIIRFKDLTPEAQKRVAAWYGCTPDPDFIIRKSKRSIRR